MPMKPILVVIPEKLYCHTSTGERVYDDDMNVHDLFHFFRRQWKEVYTPLRESYLKHLKVVNAIYDALGVAENDRIVWYTELDFSEVFAFRTYKQIIAKFYPVIERRRYYDYSIPTKYIENFVKILLIQIEIVKQAIGYMLQFITTRMTEIRDKHPELVQNIVDVATAEGLLETLGDCL